MTSGWTCATVLALLLIGSGTRAAELTPIERAWLVAAKPVLAFAKERALPLDIIVQPQPAPGQTPVGMAFVDGRCKLVLSMRGNPAAQATLDSIDQGLLQPVIEAITAHELGHCWRHVQGHWGTLPQGFREAGSLNGLAPEDAARTRHVWRERREEGFADLVGLAWTLRHHPTRYAEVHAWYSRVRSFERLENGAHDTRAWVRLAADRTKFTPASSIFEQATALWQAGLLGDS